MKLLVLALTCLAVFSAAVSAQPVLSSWKRVQPTGEEFSVETPIELTVVGSDRQGARRHMVKLNDAYFYVFSEPLNARFYLGAVNGFLTASGQDKIDLATEDTPVSREFLDPHGYYQCVTAVRTASRVYIAQTVAKDRDDISAKRFISSFAIGESRQALTSASHPPEEIRLVERAAPAAGLASGSATTAPAPAAGTNEALKILSKARPHYTDLARIYGIEGSIIVRVNFLENGSIGSVVPAKTLPFGLTESAVEAARKITFTPAIYNGAPITVAKSVEFIFAIF